MTLGAVGPGRSNRASRCGDVSRLEGIHLYHGVRDVEIIPNPANEENR
jgi:hypothetical protein